MLQSQVVFTLLFAMIWLGERWQPHHWVALPLAWAGLYLIATNGEGNLTLLGFVLTLCAAACWGLGNVINRQIGLRYQTSLPSLIAWGGLVPILPFFALSWLFEGPMSLPPACSTSAGRGSCACSICPWSPPGLATASGGGC